MGLIVYTFDHFKNFGYSLNKPQDIKWVQVIDNHGKLLHKVVDASNRTVP